MYSIVICKEVFQLPKIVDFKNGHSQAHWQLNSTFQCITFTHRSVNMVKQLFTAYNSNFLPNANQNFIARILVDVKDQKASRVTKARKGACLVILNRGSLHELRRHSNSTSRQNQLHSMTVTETIKSAVGLSTSPPGTLYSPIEPFFLTSR